MGIIKILAKTYGNYFFTMQGLKVLKTMKKDENIVVGLGKLFIADKLMDMAQGLLKSDDKDWTISEWFNPGMEISEINNLI